MSNSDKARLERRDVLKRITTLGTGSVVLAGSAMGRETGRARGRGKNRRPVEKPGKPEKIVYDGTPENPVIVEANGSDSDGMLLAQGCQRHFDETFSPGGVDIHYWGHFGCCEAEFNIELLGQKSTTSLSSCNEVCEDIDLDYGVMMLDYRLCYDNDSLEITFDYELTHWTVTGWNTIYGYHIIT